MRLFVDMDGTLAKWNNVAFEQLYEEGYYRNLEPNKRLLNDIKYILQKGNYDIYVLSAYLTDSKYALQEKKEWLKEHLPELPEEKQLFVPFGESKAAFFDKNNLTPITATDILLDDYTKNLLEWKEWGGTGVKCLNGINHTNKTWQGDAYSLEEQFYTTSTGEHRIAKELIAIVNDFKNYPDEYAFVSSHPVLRTKGIEYFSDFQSIMSAYNTLEENQSEIMPIRVGYIGNNGQANRVYSTNGKSICLSANGGGGGSKTGLYAINVGEYKAVQRAIPILEKKYGYIPQLFNPYNELEIINKAPTVTTSGFTGTSGVAIFQKTDIPIYVVKNGIITINDKQYLSRLDDGYYIIRRLSVIETKRLQTVPDDYIMPCSSSQNYKMLGNGWTVDVIAHILSHIPNISNEEIIVLSMYDGMSCGHIALDKLGANVKKYFATEIDKYCIETTKANYPNTIQLGDAMYVRTELFWNRLNGMMP